MSAARRKILIAIDESIHSKRAFDYYVKEVWKEDDEVVLVHMFTPPQPPAMSTKAPLNAHEDGHKHHPFGHDLFLTGSSNEHWVKWRRKVDQRIDELKKILQQFEGLCDDKGILRRAILHSGAPGQGICELAQDNNATLVIVGSRGLNMIRRTLLGSVSDYVLHHSTAAVLIVPPEN